MKKIQKDRFISAEPATGSLDPNPGSTNRVPVVVLSFGSEEGPVEDRAISIVDAQQMVVGILQSLATLGDPLALAIGNQFFSEVSDASDVPDTSDED